MQVPVDLGTVSQRVDSGSYYPDPMHVLRDVALVWRNQGIAVFDKLWRKGRLDRLTVSFLLFTLPCGLAYI